MAGVLLFPRSNLLRNTSLIRVCVNARAPRFRPLVVHSLKSGGHSSGGGELWFNQSADDLQLDPESFTSIRHSRGMPLKTERNDISAAKRDGLSMINRRMYSKDEFRAKLRARGHSSAVIEETVQYIAELGYLSDRDYAEAYARQQWRVKKWSPAMIRGELLRKGVGEDDIENALGEVFGAAKGYLEVKDLADKAEIQRLKEEAIDRIRTGKDAGAKESAREELEVLEEEERQLELTETLVESARRYIEGSRGQPKEKRRAKLAAWLQRKRHSWGTIKAVIDQVEL